MKTSHITGHIADLTFSECSLLQSYLFPTTSKINLYMIAEVVSFVQTIVYLFNAALACNQNYAACANLQVEKCASV